MPDITTITLSDLPAVAEFLANFPGDKFSAAEWRARLHAWWDLNPAFIEGRTARGWLLLDFGKIAGIVGNIPLLFRQDNRENVVHAGTTWRVLSTHRGHGLAIKRRQMQEHREALHFSTTPAPQVVALLKILGYQPMSQLQGGDEQSAIVLNFRTILAARFARLPLGKLAAGLLAPVVEFWQSLELRKLRAPAAFSVRQMTHAGIEFDDLWLRTRERFAFTNVRSAAAIGWYCFTVPSGRKKLLGCYEGDRLLGYAILLLEPEPGRLVGRCVDLWIDPAAGDGVVTALVIAAKKWATDQRCDQLILPHFHADLAAAYARLGVPRRPVWQRRAYLAGPKELVAKMTPTNTYLVEAQGDLGL